MLHKFISLISCHEQDDYSGCMREVDRAFQTASPLLSNKKVNAHALIIVAYSKKEQGHSERVNATREADKG